MKPGGSTSLRGTLLRWLLLPAVLVVPINALLTYRESVAISNAAYDRSLLGVMPTFAPLGSLGIYTLGGSASYRRVAVEPLGVGSYVEEKGHGHGQGLLSEG